MGGSRDPWIATCNWEEREKNLNEEYLSLGDPPSRVWATDATGEEKSLKTQKSEKKGDSKWDFFKTLLELKTWKKKKLHTKMSKT